jgi:protocatechuate 4,5-dioxygenase beta chain
MGRIVAALACSHAPSLMVSPERWEPIWRTLISRRRADLPLPPKAERETIAINQGQYGRAIAALTRLRQGLVDSGARVLIVVGDDQDENYHESAMPPFCVYTGEDSFGYPFKPLHSYFAEPPGERHVVKHRPELALRLLEELFEAGFDPSYSRQWSDQRWGMPHSIIRPLHFLTPDGELPVIPIHVNAYHPPCPSPPRCYQFGQAIRRIVEERFPNIAVAIVGSGGLSHDPFGLRGGNIDEAHDEWVMQRLQRGEGKALASLSGQDLQNAIDVELRSWIVVAGAAESVPATFTEYIPSYRTVVGLGFAFWELEASN